MDAFIQDNMLGLMTLLVTVVGVFAAVRLSLKQLIKDVADIKSKTEAKDEAHDQLLAKHDKEIAVIQAELASLTGWMREMRDKISGIYDRMFEGK